MKGWPARSSQIFEVRRVTDNGSNQAIVRLKYLSSRGSEGPRDPALERGRGRKREASAQSLGRRRLSRASLVCSVTSQMAAKHLTRLAASLIMNLCHVQKRKWYSMKERKTERAEWCRKPKSREFNPTLVTYTLNLLEVTNASLTFCLTKVILSTVVLISLMKSLMKNVC